MNISYLGMATLTGNLAPDSFLTLVRRKLQFDLSQLKPTALTGYTGHSDTSLGAISPTTFIFFLSFPFIFSFFPLGSVGSELAFRFWTGILDILPHKKHGNIWVYGFYIDYKFWAEGTGPDRTGLDLAGIVGRLDT